MREVRELVDVRVATGRGIQMADPAEKPNTGTRPTTDYTWQTPRGYEEDAGRVGVVRVFKLVNRWDVCEAVERPLPRPSAEEYAAARLLEALVESLLALKFVEEGLVRNAAGKAFQAWRAVLAALLRLELDKLKAAAKDEEERRWLEERAVPRVPTTKMIPLSQSLRELGYADVSYITSLALNLHDYQYHGPDPDMALSKYKSREEAAVAVRELVDAVAGYVERLRSRVKWTEEHEKARAQLREKLKK